VSPVTLGLAGLGVYLAVLAVVAEAARRARRDRSPADHFLAGRALGVPVLFLTLYATAFSGNSLIGYPAEAYRRGYAWIMATAFMLAIVVVSHALVPRLRPAAVTHGFVTPGDWVRHRFRGEPGAAAATVTVGVLMTVALANFLLAQLVAMGHVASQVSGGVIPYAAGVVGFAAVVLLYETVGGMRAVAWTDVLQGVMMLVGLGALLAWLLGEAGGLAAVTARVAAVRPDAVAVPAGVECVNWASTIVLVGIGAAIYPQAIQRIYAARSGRTLTRALALLAFMPLVTIVVVTLVGVAAIPRFAHLGAIESDTVIPRLLAAWAASGSSGAILATLVLVGALAAVMSTADSVLLSLGSVVAGDVLGRPRDDPRTTRAGKLAATAVLVLMAVPALVPRATLWRLTELKMELLVQCAPAFLLGLHWQGLRARPTTAGIGAGTAVAVAGVLTGVTRLGGVHVGVVGLLVNLAVAVLGSRRAPAARRRGYCPKLGSLGHPGVEIRTRSVHSTLAIRR
jgi:SSS family solute:Na+ symporter/sodium/pantothenate symporter